MYIRSSIVIVILIALLSFQSCNVNPDCIELCKQLKSSYNHNQKPIELEGYVYTDIQEWNDSIKSVRIKLHSYPFATGSNLLTSDIYIKVGEKKNNISIPNTKNYKPNDINLTDNNNNKFGLGNKIRIKGTVYYTNMQNYSPASNDSLDYSYRIEDVTFEKL